MVSQEMGISMRELYNEWSAGEFFYLVTYLAHKSDTMERYHKILDQKSRSKGK